MKHFHISTLTSKKSAYDYFAGLRCLTNNTFPDEVPDRYRELLQMSRIWNHLTMVRQSGQAHHIDTLLTHRRPGSLTVRCPACPEVTFNVDQAVVDAAKVAETHKYTLFLSVDGNFRLQRKNKNTDPDDVALNNGNGYFVPSEPYKKYQEVVRKSGPEEAATCSHLRASRMQNIAKFKNAAVSGVVAFQCARHGFYLPQSIVDLIKGEAFCFTDFALCYVLLELMLLHWILLSYDIWCQYQVNLLKRFRQWFPGPIADQIPKIRGAIPKMHIENHVIACMHLYSFTYLPYSGETWGENIEGGWAEQNQSAGSTKEMNDGHRHDALDDIFGYWNWSKLISMNKTLSRMYKACLQTLEIREANFASLTDMQPEDIVKQWEGMDISPVMVDGAVVSVYEARITGGPPTMNKALQALVDESKRVEEEDSEVIWLINSGINLQERQVAIAAQTNGKTKLSKDIQEWKTKQVLMFPSLSTVSSSGQEAGEEEIETVTLSLPSSFNSKDRDRLGLKHAASIERTLREGQAHDALAELRLAIKTVNANIHFKRQNIFGQRQVTRAEQHLRSLQAEKKVAMDKYCRAYNALLRLGHSPTDKNLQPLEESMLWGKNMTERHKKGNSRLVEPWFWHTGRPSTQTPEEENAWSLESKYSLDVL
ncbi:hypothetical protein H0H93_009346 [Arthromyces matolae]|nr:hypothetical protein H0H93_009346 [Arthromyces matolae]